MLGRWSSSVKSERTRSQGQLPEAGLSHNNQRAMPSAAILSELNQHLLSQKNISDTIERWYGRYFRISCRHIVNLQRRSSVHPIRDLDAVGKSSFAGSSPFKNLILVIEQVLVVMIRY
jgi:hypothetical protein